ncbi:MAG: DegT/DnrJ/EryC1/StrS aminotransferase family protein [Elusimicrobia bacterium]|nr:DegT/DnrJ/EryC1/StrS aminotransferase family protein [Elusimicrobiota bacterium]
MTAFQKRSDYLPFSKPTIGDEEIAEVADSMRSGWLTTGPKTQRFAEAFKNYIGCKYAVPLNSATAGLHVAYIAAGARPFDEIVTSAMTFASTANTILHAGAKPVLADIEVETLNVSPDTLKAVFSPATRIIVPVHFAGLPCDMDPILKLARERNAIVIEDAAHAVGAQYKGRKIGTIGDMTVFSFHPNKNMTTGEGGMVAGNDEQYREQLELLSFHGMNKNAWKRFSATGTPHYAIDIPGFKYNMLDIQAAIGLHQLVKIDAFNRRRAELVKRYYEAFSGIEELGLTKKPSYEHLHAWHLFAPLVRSEKLKIDRDGFMQALKELNIGTGVHYRAVHMHPLYEKLGFRRGQFPKAEYVSDRIVSLPLFPSMTEKDQEDVIAAVKQVIAKNLNK